MGFMGELDWAMSIWGRTAQILGRLLARQALPAGSPAWMTAVLRGSLFGGYEFNDYFSGEVGYSDLGDAQANFVATAPTAATVKLDAEVSAFLGRGRWHVST